MLRNEGERLVRVIVSSPKKEYFRATDRVAHNMNEAADPETTQAQHRAVVTAMVERGIEVVDVRELEGHPNSVFTRDCSLVSPQGYVKLRMGLSTRRGEEDWMANALEGLDEPCAGEVERPGSLEGGDVVLAGRIAFVGHSERSNTEGVRQVAELFQKMGYQVRIADVIGALHLGGLMSMVAPDRVLACRGDYPAGFFRGFDVIWMEKKGPSTGNVICLGPNEVLANEAENREAMDVLASRGVVVHGVDLSEFRKGAGGPTCLILPVERG